MKRSRPESIVRSYFDTAKNDGLFRHAACVTFPPEQLT